MLMTLTCTSSSYQAIKFTLSMEVHVKISLIASFLFLLDFIYNFVKRSLYIHRSFTHSN